MKLTSNGQRGTTRPGSALGIFVLLLFFGVILFYFMPTTRYHKIVYNWINAQLTTLTGRPVQISFDSFFDNAMGKVKVFQNNLQKEDSRRREVLNQE
jgi:hypothetical protein